MVDNANMELLSFFQTSDLALQFNRLYGSAKTVNERDFLFQFCLQYLNKSPLSQQAETTFLNFVSKKNKVKFITGYRSLKHKIYSVAALRYTLSVVAPEDRLTAFTEFVRQQRFNASISIGDANDETAMIARHTQLYLRVNDADVTLMKQAGADAHCKAAFYVYWQSPDIFYWLKDALNAYGFVALNYPRYFKPVSPCRIEVEINDQLQQPLLAVGKQLAEQRFPELTKQLE